MFSYFVSEESPPFKGCYWLKNYVVWLHTYAWSLVKDPCIRCPSRVLILYLIPSVDTTRPRNLSGICVLLVVSSVFRLWRTSDSLIGIYKIPHSSMMRSQNSTNNNAHPGHSSFLLSIASRDRKSSRPVTYLSRPSRPCLRLMSEKLSISSIVRATDCFATSSCFGFISR